MSDMVERVEKALAIHFSGNRQPCMSGDPRDRLSPLQRRNLADAARAAIEAMRTPTEAMKVAGCNHDDPLGRLVDWRGENTTTREAVSGVFIAMLTAALNEPMKESGQ